MLSGHLRTFRETAPLLLAKIVKPTQADVFISTWDTLGHSDMKRYTVAEQEAEVDEAQARVAYGDVKGIHVESYDASRFDLIDKINPLSGKPNRNHALYSDAFINGMMKRIRSMYYKVWDADRLRREYEEAHGIKYDRLVRARPDLAFVRPIPDDFDLGRNVVFIAKSQLFFNWNDQFAVGGNAPMTTYCNMHNMIDQYVADNFRPGRWIEGLLKHHLNRHGIDRVISAQEPDRYRPEEGQQTNAGSSQRGDSRRRSPCLRATGQR